MPVASQRECGPRQCGRRRDVRHCAARGLELRRTAWQYDDTAGVQLTFVLRRTYDFFGDDVALRVAVLALRPFWGNVPASPTPTPTVVDREQEIYSETLGNNSISIIIYIPGRIGM